MPHGTPPASQNYQVGGVIVQLGTWTIDAVSGEPLVFTKTLDLGNIVSLEIDPTNLEVLQHFTARSGARKVDKQVVTQKRLLFRIGLDEHAPELYARYFMGDAVTTDATEDGVTPLTNPLAETGILIIYRNEDGAIWRYKHNKVTIRPSGAMGFGEFDDFVGFELEVEALFNEAQIGSGGPPGMPQGVFEFDQPDPFVIP